MGVLKKLDVPLGWRPDKYTRVVNLINVSDKNNNKYYDMYDNGNGEWTACYGRVDVTQATETHPMNEWDSKYKSKLKKGYQDVTHLRTIKESKTSSTKNEVIDIKDSKVKRFVEDLQGYSNRSIKDNYTVTAADVTQAQVDEAQSILDRLVARATLKEKTDYINADLLALYRTIPRRMKNVRDHLLNFSEIKSNDNLISFKDIIGNEQMTLDVMRGQLHKSSMLLRQPQRKLMFLQLWV